MVVVVVLVLVAAAAGVSVACSPSARSRAPHGWRSLDWKPPPRCCHSNVPETTPAGCHSCWQLAQVAGCPKLDSTAATGSLIMMCLLSGLLGPRRDRNYEKHACRGKSCTIISWAWPETMCLLTSRHAAACPGHTTLNTSAKKRNVLTTRAAPNRTASRPFALDATRHPKCLCQSWQAPNTIHTHALSVKPRGRVWPQQTTDEDHATPAAHWFLK